eukprot:TRINITY_DN5157_c0_g1_i1.p1 TRINITY_DN5157_c0_g1~~TRINITY_DN5157_c0_g1_i1.p1  ORF type:complete len:513 (-),score=115.00 TRINITY_DN5157_c0_g1_i1:6-1544(-)
MSSVLKEGWLHKKGDVRRNWTRRWFVMRDLSIEYFENIPGTHAKAKGAIPLRGAQVFVPTEAMARPHCFAVQLVHRIYYMSADSQVEAEAWTATINSAIQDLVYGSMDFGFAKRKPAQQQENDPAPALASTSLPAMPIPTGKTGAEYSSIARSLSPTRPSVLSSSPSLPPAPSSSTAKPTKLGVGPKGLPRPGLPPPIPIPKASKTLPPSTVPPRQEEYAAEDTRTEETPHQEDISTPAPAPTPSMPPPALPPRDPLPPPPPPKTTLPLPPVAPGPPSHPSVSLPPPPSLVKSFVLPPPPPPLMKASLPPPPPVIKPTTPPPLPPVKSTPPAPPPPLKSTPPPPPVKLAPSLPPLPKSPDPPILPRPVTPPKRDMEDARAPTSQEPSEITLHTTGFETRNSEFIVFRIEVQWRGMSWTIFRRFKQFDEVDTKIGPHVRPVSLPDKTGLKKKLEAEFAESRMGGINLYLKECMSKFNSIMANASSRGAFMKFVSPLQMGDIKGENFSFDKLNK